MVHKGYLVVMAGVAAGIGQKDPRTCHSRDTLAGKLDQAKARRVLEHAVPGLTWQDS